MAHCFNDPFILNYHVLLALRTMYIFTCVVLVYHVKHSFNFHYLHPAIHPLVITHYIGDVRV